MKINIWWCRWGEMGGGNLCLQKGGLKEILETLILAKQLRIGIRY